MKKRNILIIVLLLVIVGAIFYMFFSDKKTDDLKEIKQITLTTTNASAIEEVYEIKSQTNGIDVVYYLNNIIDDSKTIVHQTSFGLDKYDELCKVLNDAEVNKWNGWHKTNSLVLDGGGFSFQLIKKDEEEIIASGSNATPNNYGEVYDEIVDLCTSELIKSTKFKTKEYQLELPKEWIDVVNVRFFQDFISFYLKVDNKDCSILNIYNNTYGYYDGDEYIHLKEKKINGETHYLFCRKDDSIDYYKDKANDEQLSVINYLDDSVDEVIKSFK